MKILQTISGLSIKAGGPSTCTHDMLQGISELRDESLEKRDESLELRDRIQVDMLTVKCANPNEHNLGEGSSWLKEAENDYRTPFVISKNAQKFMKENDYDLYHCNALWMGMNHDTCRIAREKGKPYIISPHGMLYPTALAVHTWKKKILLNLWYNKDIHNACCLHATCKAEAEHCRAFGYKGPIAVIPNAVVIPKGIKIKEDCSELRDSRGRRRIGFLGRLHPIKKVENIIYAMAKLRAEGLDIRDRLSFQIMGKYDDEYEQWLKDEVKRLGLEGCVEFVGFVNGMEKYDRLSKLTVLMVPSAQENFGMIVPEALICGTPVYASLGTPWSELNEVNAGWWKENSPESIAEVIEGILSLSDDELLQKGQNGRRLIEEKYEQHKVAEMMVKLYEWILKDNMDTTQKPAFVYLDEIK